MQADPEQHQRPQEDRQQRGQNELKQGDCDVAALSGDDYPDQHPDHIEPPAALEDSHGFDSLMRQPVLAPARSPDKS